MSETLSSGAAALRITLVRSTIGRPKDQEATVRALGLRRMHHTVERPDNPSIRGMVTKIRHLVRVEEMTAGAESVPLQGTNRPAAASGSPFVRYVAAGDDGEG